MPTRQKTVTFILALVISVSTTIAAEPADVAKKRELAEKLMNILRISETMTRSFDMIKKMQLDMMAKRLQGKNIQKMEELNRSMMELIARELSWKNLKDPFIDIYIESFTDEEIDALIEFYGSPIGQKLLGKQPEIEQKTMQLVQSIMMKLMPKIDKISKKFADKQLSNPKTQSLQQHTRFVNRLENPEKLNEIKFPEKTDDDNLSKYVLEILIASQEQNSFRTDDLQVKMFMRVGADHVDILIDALQHANRYHHLIYAINILASDKNKELIFKALSRYPDLAEAVIKNRWEKDAEDILLNRLKNQSPQYISTSWLTAVINLNDKNNYPYLINHFVNGHNKYITYEKIKNLPGIELDKAIVEAWANTTSGDNSWDMVLMSILAVKYGKKDALETLISNLNDGKYGYYSARMRMAALLHTEATGSNGDIQVWYQKNRLKLYFDQADEKFRVKQTTPAPE